MSSPSDEELLAAVSGGDRLALGSLYERHAPWLTLRLSRRCPDPGTVDEVVQDTFLAVWRGAGRFAGQGEVVAALASGRVWVDDQEASSGTAVSWRTGEGAVRHIGDPPTGAQVVSPTLEDGYLLLLHNVEEQRAA